MEPQTTQTLRLERTFDCTPRELWDAWADPRQYAKWFNPFPGEDAEILEWEFREGGKVRFHMVMPDGTKLPNEGQFLVIHPFSELVTGEGDMRVKVTFEPVGAQTRMVMTQTGLPVDVDLDQARGGWGAILDKLDGHVTAVGAREIVTTRVFDATPERVFEAWTDPDQVVEWWGPDGFSNTNHEMSVRPGGLWRFTMHGPDGTDYPNRIAFDEVVPAKRLAYVHGSDEEPDQFRVRVTFEAEGGRTRVTMRARFPTPEACAAVKGFAVEGAEQTLAKLEKFVASA